MKRLQEDIHEFFWMAGSILFIRTKEQKNDTLNFEEIDWPMISILVPCYNEEETIEETVRNLTGLSYPKKRNHFDQ
ncbi:hypothetical protein [Planococcus halotolerans]|uniref:hypothetical protein n=1 Tax=Planococcus halotolerans TaxID=2233542 RepID=UPI001F0C08B9|nr:hypothetical protein [Planococcus halotolerans]